MVVYKRDPPSGFDEPPNWTLVALIGGIGALGLLGGLVVLAWKRIGALIGPSIIVMAAITVVADVVSIATESVVVPGELQDAPDVAESSQARRVLLGSHSHMDLCDHQPTHARLRSRSCRRPRRTKRVPSGECSRRFFAKFLLIESGDPGGPDEIRTHGTCSGGLDPDRREAIADRHLVGHSL